MLYRIPAPRNKPLVFELTPAAEEHVVPHNLGRIPFVQFQQGSRLKGVITDATAEQVTVSAPGNPFTATLLLL